MDSYIFTCIVTSSTKFVFHCLIGRKAGLISNFWDIFPFSSRSEYTEPNMRTLNIKQVLNALYTVAIFLFMVREQGRDLTQYRDKGPFLTENPNR